MSIIIIRLQIFKLIFLSKKYFLFVALKLKEIFFLFLIFRIHFRFRGVKFVTELTIYLITRSAGSTQTCERVYVWNQLQAIMCRMHRLLFSQCWQHKNGIRSRPLFLHCPYFERPHSDLLFRLSESDVCLWIHTRSCSSNIFVLNISAPRILSKSSSGSSCANLNLLTLERPCAIPAPCVAWL